MTSPTPSEERDDPVAKFAARAETWSLGTNKARLSVPLGEVRAALAEITRLRAEVERLSKPEWFWDAQDPEDSTDCWQDLITDALCPDEVMKIGCARDLPRKWGATRCLTVDEHGDPDDTEPVLFDTEAEARACWPASLLVARAARGTAE